MKDRRTYSRLSVNIDGNLYYLNIEKNVNISNLSEDGIGFVVDIRKDCFPLKRGDCVEIQFVDDFQFGTEIYSTVQQVNCVIQHIRQVTAEKTYIGCKVPTSNEEYFKYVEKRKSGHFIEVINHIWY